VIALAIMAYSALQVLPDAAPRFRGSVIDQAAPAPDFSLADTTGQDYSLSSSRGKVVLLFFGYTQCPDECPATMAQFTRIRADLGAKANEADFVLISVDPQRDTPEVIKSYVATFDPAIHGLTGTKDQLTPVWNSYGVAVEYTPSATPDGYLVPNLHVRYYPGRYGTRSPPAAEGKISMSPWKDAVRRVLISLVISSALAIAVSEAAYLFSPDRLIRSPQRIEMVIPAGTAAKIAAGQAIPSLPAEMTFLEGDTLVVINQDDTSHQLGPVWVPPGKSGSILLSEASQYSYACTFQPNRYQGIDVRKPVTFSTRLQAVLLIGLPTTTLLAFYSYVVFPAGGKDDDEGREE
jgi:protein SCO1/2